MSSSNLKLKCKKCHCCISEDSNGRLCDNCNMDLIAQNLAAELSQHEIHHQDANDLDISPGTPCESPPVEIKIKDIALKLQCSLKEAVKFDSDNSKAECNATSDDEPKTFLSPQSKTDDGNETASNQLEEDQNCLGSSPNDKDKRDEQLLDIIDCLPSTSFSTPTRNDCRKRKLDEMNDQVEKSSKIKEEESSDDETDVKKPDIKLEPMRTRAKVVQEEAAALKQHDLSMEEERLIENDEGEEEDDSKGPVRRLTRKALSEIEKYKHPSYEPVQTKSRRTKTFKAKPVYKAPTSQARIYSSDYVFHKGRYYQIGDIVLLRDTARPGDFFAQITSFLTDQYCHKCATIQWLFPTKQSPVSGFDPRTYFLGYLDEIPRPLSALQPVMHLPSDYYRFNKTPYPPPTPDPLKKRYLWMRSEPVSLEALQQG